MPRLVPELPEIGQETVGAANGQVRELLENGEGIIRPASVV